MADKQKSIFKWKTFSLVAYLFATTVGYLYATGYYGDFGIDILNYVEPIDFLLISLDNVQDVLTFSGLIVPFILPSIILILAGVIAFGLIVILASLAVYLSLALILCSGALFVLATLATIAAVVSHIADQSKRMGKALRAAFGRQQGTEEERPSTFGEKVRRLVITYNKEMAEARPSKPSAKENDYYNDVKEVTLGIPRVWSWIPQVLRPIRDRILRWMRGFFESKSSWRPKGWTSLGRLRQLVVVAAFAYIGAAAYVHGKVVAQKIRLDAESAASAGQSNTAPNGTSNAEDRAAVDDQQPSARLVDGADVESGAATTSDQVAGSVEVASRVNAPTGVEKTWSIFARAICPIVPLISCDAGARPVATYAVPTANLATLELNECKENVDSLKFARANLRQDANDAAHRGASDCHVYLGATGSMQFLADFDGVDDKRSPTEHQSDSQRSAPVVVVAGGGAWPPPPVEPLDIQTFTVVFHAENGAVSAPACNLELVAVVGPFQTGKTEVEKIAKVCDVPGRSGGIETVSEGNAIEGLGDYGTLVLVGRADVRPINNRDFESNMALAEARVDKVAASLDGDHRSLRVLNIPAGPVDAPQGAHACSRVVEIYGCPASGPSTSVGTAGATGAGGKS